MKRLAPFVVGGIVLGVGASFFFDHAKVALPRNFAKRNFFHGTLRNTRHSAITQADLEQVFSEDFVAVAGPSGATPDELVRTVISDTWLPKEVRAPYVALAKAKAPQLLRGKRDVIMKEAHVTEPQ